MQKTESSQSGVLARSGKAQFGRGLPTWKFWPLLAALILLGAAGVSESARFLVVDKPEHADAILVLAGETNQRPARALQLVSEGYAPRIILDVPDWSQFYDRSEMQIAQEWAAKQAHPITICPIHGLSTKDESRDVAKCIKAAGVHDILIVTSDFHTRRSLSIFRHELPGYKFGVAAAYDSTQFGVNWWQHREWAKTNFYEWTRLLWWELIDRWF